MRDVHWTEERANDHLPYSVDLCRLAIHIAARLVVRYPRSPLNSGGGGQTLLAGFFIVTFAVPSTLVIIVSWLNNAIIGRN